MNKRGYAQLIVDSVLAHDDQTDVDDVVDQVVGMLNCVQPKDPELFAAWGKMSEQVEPNECWT
jgi:hypothetical protein